MTGAPRRRRGVGLCEALGPDFVLAPILQTRLCIIGDAGKADPGDAHAGGFNQHARAAHEASGDHQMQGPHDGLHEAPAAFRGLMA